MLMGIADLIPGISGGTIALITGIYKDLITALNNLTFKNIKFNFLKNLKIFPMEELSKPKNFNENLNFKMSNMNMNIKIQYLKKSEKFQSYYWVDEKKLDSYMLPSFTKKIVRFLERK